ncbi:hypothetical protein L1987_63863 [Smallanthus sonchifolius]|uniref:Uncharacterized protein n=1 Tax=Smallanthus sonchifolius TaxID=185202 RepID=A0ACB9CEH2_9ASTR|nr:hypothetical protein L1987_63863 [Smallanthus sonchifolius]
MAIRTKASCSIKLNTIPLSSSSRNRNHTLNLSFHFNFSIRVYSSNFLILIESWCKYLTSSGDGRRGFAYS